MIRFLVKGLLRDRHRSFFPVLVVSLGVMLTVLLDCWIEGALGDMTELNARFTTGHVKVMSREYADHATTEPPEQTVNLHGDFSSTWTNATGITTLLPELGLDSNQVLMVGIDHEDAVGLTGGATRELWVHNHPPTRPIPYEMKPSGATTENANTKDWLMILDDAPTLTWTLDDADQDAQGVVVGDEDGECISAFCCMGLQVIVRTIRDPDRLHPAETFGKYLRIPAVQRVMGTFCREMLAESEFVRTDADRHQNFVRQCNVIRNVFIRHESRVNRTTHRGYYRSVPCHLLGLSPEGDDIVRVS